MWKVPKPTLENLSQEDCVVIQFHHVTTLCGGYLRVNNSCLVFVERKNCWE